MLCSNKPEASLPSAADLVQEAARATGVSCQALAESFRTSMNFCAKLLCASCAFLRRFSPAAPVAFGGRGGQKSLLGAQQHKQGMQEGCEWRSEG